MKYMTLYSLDSHNEEIQVIHLQPHYLGLKNFFASTVALPNTSELSFTMVCADFEPATFCVTLFMNCPVSVIAPLIDPEACLDGVA